MVKQNKPKKIQIKRNTVMHKYPYLTQGCPVECNNAHCPILQRAPQDIFNTMFWLPTFCRDVSKMQLCTRQSKHSCRSRRICRHLLAECMQQAEAKYQWDTPLHLCSRCFLVFIMTKSQNLKKNNTIGTHQKRDSFSQPKHVLEGPIEIKLILQFNTFCLVV